MLLTRFQLLLRETLLYSDGSENAVVTVFNLCRCDWCVQARNDRLSINYETTHGTLEFGLNDDWLRSRHRNLYWLKRILVKWMMCLWMFTQNQAGSLILSETHMDLLPKCRGNCAKLFVATSTHFYAVNLLFIERGFCQLSTSFGSGVRHKINSWQNFQMLKTSASRSSLEIVSILHTTVCTVVDFSTGNMSSHQDFVKAIFCLAKRMTGSSFDGCIG